MYKAPIEIVEDIRNKYLKQREEWIVSAVISCGINVDKERLLHALEYDKYAYESGYSEGKLDAMKELVRCKDCKWYRNADDKYFPRTCDHWSDMFHHFTDWESVDENGFCSWGKRKDGADHETV